ncbi:Trehalose utilization [Stieleria bergensis]|uniref:Trehalose utilization n=1 Tax=Stieleria bergensis TaxID=2528025 RepID=A0A517SXV6_9BACT|nr:Trehalose utilization [Planctomycetes bacterium SV_7m_r]
MNRKTFLTAFVCALAVVTTVSASTASAAEKLKALIIDGQNNHSAWPQTTAMMKKYLTDTGKFDVDIARTKFTWNGRDLLKKYPAGDGVAREDLKSSKSDPGFKPDFSQYDVVVSNFGHGAAAWPEATQKALHEFVSGGGGFVVIHAADNSFGDWNEYNQMIGLGGWGGRNEAAGPYVFYNNDGKLVRDESKGRGGAHGPQHEFQIVVREPEHPIVKGLPMGWMHTKDELYQELRGPASNMNVLATAYADPKFRGTDRHEPMLMTIDYGKGRVYHTPMGHAAEAVACVGFITTFIRGTEWAATGQVTLTDVPSDFPSSSKSSSRQFDN